MLISFNPEVVDEISIMLKHHNDLKLKENTLEIDNSHPFMSELQLRNIKYKIINKIKLRLFGMTCTSCSGAIEDNVGILPGVIDCQVNLAMEYCIINHYKKEIGIRDIITRIEELGFDALMMDMSGSIQLDHLQKTKDIIELRTAFQRSLLYAIPTMLLMFIHKGPEVYNIYISHFIQFILATAAMCTVGKRFYVHAYLGLKSWSFTMDTLVALGTLSAYLFSVVMMIHRIFHKDEHLIVFFDTVTMLLTFILLGKLMETSAKVRTSSALSSLLQLKPDKATLVEFNEKGKLLTFTNDAMSLNRFWETVHFDQIIQKESLIDSDFIQYNDCLSILPGERIPADGYIIYGSSSIDESLITGESLPVNKQISDPVVCGSINGPSPFKMIANAVGNETTLERIIQLVEQAQSIKAPIEYVSDAIASVFVPFVVILAVLTFFGWYVLLNVIEPDDAFFEFLGTQDKTDTLFTCVKICISVVVIACPCTLGLAVPTSVMVGSGVSAQLGILIKGGSSLEQANNLTTLVFDKTGTLTTGKMSVVKVNKKETKLSLKDLNILLAATESQSEHPIGKAIVKYALNQLNMTQEQLRQQCSVISTDNKPGYGMLVTISLSNQELPQNIIIGNKNLLEQYEIDCSSMTEFVQQQSLLGNTCIYIAVNQELSACLSIGDEIKPYCAETIQGLINMNIDVIMCTGDNKLTATAVANQIGITKIHAEVTPQQKAAIIKELKSRPCKRKLGWFDYILQRFKKDQRQRHVVGFVGDGINDSIALAEADVGIALGSGTDVAMETADIILMKSDLLDVVTSIDLSRKIFDRIKINFIWAFGYNMISIPLAMGFGIPFGIFMHPMLAGAAMAFSSVSVVTSSLLLKLYKVPRWIRILKGEYVYRGFMERTINKLKWVFRRDTTEYHQL